MDVPLSLKPFLVLRQRISVIFVPFIPLLFLILVFFTQFDAKDAHTLLNATDYYIGGNIHLSSADLVKYDKFGANALMPLIRLGVIAEKTSVTALFDHFPTSFPFDFEFVNFFIVYLTLTLGFLSYAMVARVVYALRYDFKDKFGFKAVNSNSITLCLIAAGVVLLLSSFTLVGFRLMLLITFGMYFTLSIPHAALGDPVGESLYKAVKFLTTGMGEMVQMYINCMGAAILTPVALLIFFLPLLLNLEQSPFTDMLMMLLGLFSVVFALFYQAALCSSVIYDFREDLEKKVRRRA